MAKYQGTDATGKIQAVAEQQDGIFLVQSLNGDASYADIVAAVATTGLDFSKIPGSNQEEIDTTYSRLRSQLEAGGPVETLADVERDNNLDGSVGFNATASDANA